MIFTTTPTTFLSFTQILNTVSILCIFQLLLSSSYALASQQFQGKCKSLCDKRRHTGHKEAFKFSCTEFDNQDDQEKCRDACEFCPKDVCDETLSKGSANDWTCPEENLTGKCKKICEDNRPYGMRENYAVVVDAGTTCKEIGCPSFVCESKNPKKYHCPYEEFVGECRVECDKAREHPSENFQATDYVTQFNFKCDQRYTGNELSNCQETCRTKCPQWVCDGNGDPNLYNCPSAQIEGDCKALCDKHRDPNHLDAAYVYRCEEECSLEEKKACESCVGPAINHNYVCNRYDLANLNFFLCPPREPNSPRAVTRLSYKGKCKDRCEANRGGGFWSYELDCRERYKTSEEQRLCQQDCKECPDDVCDEKKNDNIFKCKSVDRELERERRELAKLREPHKKELTAIVVSFGVSYLLVFLVCLGLAIYFTRRNRSPPVSVPQTQEEPVEDENAQDQETKAPPTSTSNPQQFQSRSQTNQNQKQPRTSASSPL